MWFLAPLFATLSAAVLYEKYERSSAEVAIICIAVVLAGTVLTIVASPWPIQLMLALSLIISRVMKTDTFYG